MLNHWATEVSQNDFFFFFLKQMSYNLERFKNQYEPYMNQYDYFALISTHTYVFWAIYKVTID